MDQAKLDRDAIAASRQGAAAPAQGVLALSMGEPAGVGPDLILDVFARRQELDLPAFLVYGHSDFLKARAKRLGLSVSIAAATPETAAATFAQALPVLSLAGPCPDRPGVPSADTAPLVTGAIAQGVADARAGKVRGLVTAPIHKGVLYGAGFTYPGHTEYLAELCADAGSTPRPVMMLAHGDYRVVPLTIHVPLATVPGLINAALIAETVAIIDRDLRTRFGVSNPKIAVCGLNPHAGEEGGIGNEEDEIIAPALAALRTQGFDLAGPLPADTLFYPPHWRRYDCVIAMYHDQGLIPIKTLAFDQGVNVTLGLPIVRTSPDHGTAFDLAGTGKGSARSLVAALQLADRMADVSLTAST